MRASPTFLLSYSPTLQLRANTQLLKFALPFNVDALNTSLKMLVA